MRILLLLVLFIANISTIFLASAANTPTDRELYVRDINVTDCGKTDNAVLETFIWSISSAFFSPWSGCNDGITNIFIAIAFNIKNFFIFIAVIFLIVGVMKLLFSSNSEEDVKKWRSNIIWVSAGIILMQFAFGIWNAFLVPDSTGQISSGLAGRIWGNVFLPLVRILQMVAAFGFIAMAVYAFYVIVTSGWDEEGSKKWKNILIYSIIGFILIRIPEALVSAIYGRPNCKNVWPFNLVTIGDCAIEGTDISASIGIFGKLLNWLNSFLGIVAVILILYAGWLVLISAWEEEKLKKAKRIILYIFIGMLILVASHALFRFFILQG